MKDIRLMRKKDFTEHIDVHVHLSLLGSSATMLVRGSFTSFFFNQGLFY